MNRPVANCHTQCTFCLVISVPLPLSMKMFKRIIQAAWSQVHKHALLKPVEKLPSLARSADPRVNSGTKKIISYFPSWIWSMLGSASLEKQKEAVSSAAKTELGNERCFQPWPILSKQDGEMWGPCQPRLLAAFSTTLPALRSCALPCQEPGPVLA